MSSASPGAANVEQPAEGSGWILAAICPAAFVSMLNSFALGPFFPAIALELSVSVPVLGQIPASLGIFAAILSLMVGPLADRYGHRRTLLVAAGAVAISAIGTGLAPTLTVMVFAALAGAVGRAVVVPVSFAMIGTHFANDTARRPISYVVAAQSGTVILGIPALTAVAAISGTWRGGLLVLGLVAVIALALATTLLPRDQSEGSNRLSYRSVLADVTPLLRHRPTVAIIAASFIRNLIAWIVFIYWGAFLVEQYALDGPQVGLAFTVIGLGHLLGSLVAGRWMGQIPLRPLIGGSLVLAGLLLAAAIRWPMGLLPVSAIVTVGYMMIGGAEANMPVLLLSETPSGRATTMTLAQGANTAGMAAGGAVGGLLLALGGYPAIGTMLPLFGLAGAVLVWGSRPQRDAVPAVAP